MDIPPYKPEGSGAAVAAGQAGPVVSQHDFPAES